jgi:hypothetical protein
MRRNQFIHMKTLLRAGALTLTNLSIAVSLVLAQGGGTFRGAAKTVNGSVLTVSGGGETHHFQVSGSTKITGPDGKRSDISKCLNQSVEVTYSGNKEPYRAISVQALEQ